MESGEWDGRIVSAQMSHKKRAVKKFFTLSRNFYIKSRGALPRRTPVVSSFPFFPGKERKLTGEASSAEESERIGIFPDAASSSGSHRLTMLASAFLASEKIPMILSDNGRRGLTLQRKETAARLKFSCVPGRSDAYGITDLIEESCFAA